MDASPKLHDVTGEQFCDVHLLGVEWLEAGRDLQLRLRMPQDKKRPQHDARLICRWAQMLRFTLEYPPNHGGMPLTSEGRVERSADRVWTVAFEFARKGELSLRCSEVEWIEEG
jgi:hypothetical protein